MVGKKLLNMSNKTNENSEDVLLYIDLGNEGSGRIPADKITYVTGFDIIKKEFKYYQKIIHPQIYPSKFADVILNKNRANE